MPTMCCTSCGGRREIVEYLARLPLRCTGCGRGLVAETDSVNALLANLAAPPANGVHAAEAIPSLEYVSVSNAELSDPQDSTPSPVEPLEPASMPEFTPSQTEISILPDPELAPLVVSEKFSGSTFQLPPTTTEESNKSKLAERLKEITSLPAIDLEPAPAPAPPPAPEPELASPGQRAAARALLVGLGVLAYFGGIGWMNILTRAGIVGAGTPSLLSTALYFVPLALFVAIHAALLASRGQDVGKLLVGLRILKDDGAPTTARDALWRREVPILALPLALSIAGLALAPTPAVGLACTFAAILVPLADALLIFSSSGRCLHDRLAKTIVVEK